MTTPQETSEQSQVEIAFHDWSNRAFNIRESSSTPEGADQLDRAERQAFAAAWSIQQRRIEKIEEALREIPLKMNEAGWNDSHGTGNLKNHTGVLCRIACEIARAALNSKEEAKQQNEGDL